MPDINSALAILSGGSNGGSMPSLQAAGPADNTAQLSPADRAMSILGGQPANDNAAGSYPADGSPGSVFTAPPDQPGSELRPIVSAASAGGGGYGMIGDGSQTIGGGFRGSGGAMPGQANQVPGQSFLHRAATGAQGANEGIAGVAGFPVDLMTDLLNAGSLGVKKLSGYDLGQITNPFGGSQSINSLFQKIGAEYPELDKPKDAMDQLLLSGGRGVGGVVAGLPLTAAILPGRLAAAVTEPFVTSPVAATSMATAAGVTSGLGQEAGHRIAETVAPGRRGGGT